MNDITAYVNCQVYMNAVIKFRRIVGRVPGPGKSGKAESGGMLRKVAECIIPPFPGNGGMPFISIIFDFFCQKRLIRCSDGLF